MEESQKLAKKKPRGIPFAKGHPGGPGRPQGVKNYTNLSLWLGAIWNDIADWEAERRVDVCKWAVASILAKVSNLPGTSEDSKMNVDRLLDRLETAPTMPPNAPGLDSSGGNGKNGNCA